MPYPKPITAFSSQWMPTCAPAWSLQTIWLGRWARHFRIFGHRSETRHSSACNPAKTPSTATVAAHSLSVQDHEYRRCIAGYAVCHSRTPDSDFGLYSDTSSPSVHRADKMHSCRRFFVYANSLCYITSVTSMATAYLNTSVDLLLWATKAPPAYCSTHPTMEQMHCFGYHYK